MNIGPRFRTDLVDKRFRTRMSYYEVNIARIEVITAHYTTYITCKKFRTFHLAQISDKNQGHCDEKRIRLKRDLSKRYFY